MGADDEVINIIFNYRQYEFDSCKELVTGWFNCWLVSILMNGWKRRSRTALHVEDVKILLMQYMISMLYFQMGTRHGTSGVCSRA